jgi:membrane-associated phospholipid phosphatase
MIRSFACILLICSGSLCHGQIRNERVSPYKLHPVGDVATVSAGAVLFGVGLSLTNNITPLEESDILQLDMNQISTFDRRATSHFLEKSASTSDYLLAASALSPFLLAADKRIRQDYFTIGVMFSEVILLNAGITNISKGYFQRNRPYVYNPEVPIEEKLDRGARESFFSGHVSHTAAFSFFTAHVINSYSQNQTVKTAAWIGAFTLPAVVGYLRYSSGKHYPSDIITGYVVGAAIGYFVPQLHLRKESNLNLTAGAGYFSFTYTFK